MKVEIDLQEIEGFEYTSEYRTPKVGEYILIAGSVITAQGHTYEYPILKKIEPEYQVIWINKHAGSEGQSVVPIKALDDALFILGKHMLMLSSDDIDRYDKLKQLVKGGDS